MGMRGSRGKRIVLAHAWDAVGEAANAGRGIIRSKRAPNLPLPACKSSVSYPFEAVRTQGKLVTFETTTRPLPQLLRGGQLGHGERDHAANSIILGTDVGGGRSRVMHWLCGNRMSDHPSYRSNRNETVQRRVNRHENSRSSEARSQGDGG